MLATTAHLDRPRVPSARQVPCVATLAKLHKRALLARRPAKEPPIARAVLRERLAVVELPPSAHQVRFQTRMALPASTAQLEWPALLQSGRSRWRAHQDTTLRTV